MVKDGERGLFLGGEWDMLLEALVEGVVSEG
jgi:hypothetical protein